MTDDNREHGAGSEKITRGGRLLIGAWIVGLLVLYGAVAFFGVSSLHRYRAQAWSKVEALVASAAPESGAGSSAVGAGGAAPVDVHVGTYINYIGDLLAAASSFKADFDIWFRWRGEAVSPGEHFQIVDGSVESKEKLDSYTEGDTHYERYRVQARIVTRFDTRRSPFGGGVVGFHIEDGMDGADRLRYVADEDGVGVDRDAVNPKWKIRKATGMVTNHRYPSRFGDLRLAEGSSEVHSRYSVGVSGAPSGWGIYASLFQALFVAIAIAFVAPFIKPIHVDPRFGLGIGAVFAAIGNNIVAGFALQNAEGITLAQIVNGVGLATIFLTIVQSTVSLYIYDSLGRQRLSRVFDMFCFAAFFVGYLAVNIALPMAARG
jgi:hypothetical protein